MSQRAWDGIVSRVLDQTGVSAPAFYAPGKGSLPVANARRLAVYLARVELGLSPTAIAAYSGRTDRYVRRSCAQTEEGREDRTFDRILDLLSEQIEELRPRPRTAVIAPALAALAA